MKADISYNFEKTYKEESDSIFRFCLVRVSDRDQALDITQETFTRLWQSLLEEKEILNMRAFLFTVAHHLIIDWYRKKKSFSLDSMMHKTEKKEGEVDYDPVDPRTVDDLGLKAEARFLLDKINELPEASRDPVYLRFVEGLSPGEIGDILGISYNAASVRVNRGLAELRKRTGYDLKE